MIVVTGGAGFIGSCLAAEMARLGHEVVIVDSLGDTGRWRNVRKDLFAAFVLPSLSPRFVEQNKSSIKQVFHFGADSSTTAIDGDAIIKSNIEASQFWWNFCKEQGVPLVYASSAATYGDGAQGFSDDDGAEHLARFRPLNLYGWSKHYFDRWAVREASAGAAPPVWAGLKFFNVYGPNEDHKGHMKSVVAKNYNAVASGDVVALFRSHRADVVDGGQSRDFVYVKDCIAIATWLARGLAPNGLYNVGTGKARSFSDLIGALGEALDAAPEISYVDIPESIRDKYQYFTQADMSKLTAAGYPNPIWDLASGVKDYALNYLRTGENY